jgi:3-dehydroquinate synthase II
VRLVTPNGSVSVSELKKGDEVLVHFADGGRHFGMPVKEKIKES